MLEVVALVWSCMMQLDLTGAVVVRHSFAEVSESFGIISGLFKHDRICTYRMTLILKITAFWRDFRYMTANERTQIYIVIDASYNVTKTAWLIY